jgi:hypothetical protein
MGEMKNAYHTKFQFEKLKGRDLLADVTCM